MVFHIEPCARYSETKQVPHFTELFEGSILKRRTKKCLSDSHAVALTVTIDDLGTQHDVEAGEDPYKWSSLLNSRSEMGRKLPQASLRPIHEKDTT